MSTPNRNKVLFGFGALVAVLIVAIVMWPSNFRKEDASGAIGAVQKHRAPQITPQDVVLGNEEVKHQQKVLYADFLADAAKLRAMASRDTNVANQIAAMRDDLRMRYGREFLEALNMASQAASRTADSANLSSKVDALRASVAAERSLSAAQMGNLNVKLAAIADEMKDAKSASRLAEAQEAVDFAANRMKAAKLDSAADSAELTARLKEAQEILNSKEALVGVRLSDVSDSLGAMLNEESILAEAESVASRVADQESLAMKLNVAAESLDAKGMAGIKALLNEQVEVASRLKALNETAEAASRTAGSRLGMMSSKSAVYQNLNAVSMAARNAQSRFAMQATAEMSDEALAAKSLKDGEQLQSQILNVKADLQARPQ